MVCITVGLTAAPTAGECIVVGLTKSDKTIKVKNEGEYGMILWILIFIVSFLVLPSWLLYNLKKEFRFRNLPGHENFYFLLGIIPVNIFAAAVSIFKLTGNDITEACVILATVSLLLFTISITYVLYKKILNGTISKKQKRTLLIAICYFYLFILFVTAFLIKY